MSDKMEKRFYDKIYLAFISARSNERYTVKDRVDNLLSRVGDLVTTFFYYLFLPFRHKGIDGVVYNRVEEFGNDAYVEVWFTTDDEPYCGHIYREIKIDLNGNVYFKINHRWTLQENVEEIKIYNLGGKKD